MIKLHPDSTPFFARITQADVACPRCDYVTHVGSPRLRGGRRIPRPKTPDMVWNRTTCRWRCPRCQLTLRLGVVAHPVEPKTRFALAVDAVPNLKQALELRNMVSRMSPERLTGGLAELNRVAEGEQPWVPEDDLLTRRADVVPRTAGIADAPEKARRANYWGRKEAGEEGGGGASE